MGKRKLPPPTEDERSKFRQIGWTDAEIDAAGINLATVAYYRELGYLPEAIINYLGRLGWSLDDKTEFIPLDRMIANFALERVNSSPASFDPEKLFWLAGEHMKRLPLQEKVTGCLRSSSRAKYVTDPAAPPTSRPARPPIFGRGRPAETVLRHLAVRGALLEDATPTMTRRRSNG